MKVKQVISLLKEKNIKIIDEGNTIYHDETPDIPLESYDGIILMNGVWKYCEVRKRIQPQIQVKKSFSSKSDALEHLFLHCLYWHFIFEYVIPSKSEIKQKWGRGIEQIWDIDILKQVMETLSIPEKYLCTPEKNREKSICIFKKNKKWFESYIGESMQVFESPEEGFDDEDWFFSIRLNSIYSLYLLEQYMEELLRKKIIKAPFSDIQIANFLGYNI